MYEYSMPQGWKKWITMIEQHPENCDSNTSKTKNNKSKNAQIQIRQTISWKTIPNHMFIIGTGNSIMLNRDI